MSRPFPPAPGVEALRPHAEQTVAQLVAALAGRVYPGKAALVTALGKLAVQLAPELGAGPAWEAVVTALLAEAQRTDQLYRRAAVDALAAVLRVRAPPTTWATVEPLAESVLGPAPPLDALLDARAPVAASLTATFAGVDPTANGAAADDDADDDAPGRSRKASRLALVASALALLGVAFPAAAEQDHQGAGPAAAAVGELSISSSLTRLGRALSRWWR